MPKGSTRWRPNWYAIAVFLVLSAGCSREGATPSPRPAPPAEPASQVLGDYEIHFNALRTAELSDAVAKTYGIHRGSDRVVLHVVLLRRMSDGRTVPVDGSVSASARTLTGQVTELNMRRVSLDDSIDFLGELAISGEEILVFDIVAVPSGSSERFAVELRRDFVAG